jgi:two-component system, NarL family, sensor histidine kinase DesK
MIIGDAPLGGSRQRRIAITIAVVVLLLLPAYHHHAKGMGGSGWFEVVGAIVMAGLCVWVINFTDIGASSVPWVVLTVVLGLGIALFAVGGENWLTALAVAAALWGRSTSTARPAIIACVACVAAGSVVATVHDYSFGNTVGAILTPALAGLFAYSTARRMETVESLRRTRAELARAAAAEERLRIARDLHDLLGHSLSLITLKAELAGRLVPANPERAAREIAELESVARQSLHDVREAVAGFRQPDLAGELVAARQLLDAAGITTKITAADTSGLARTVDSALAWAVREGATNVVRHSRATQVAIRVSRSPATVMAEISDNGPAAPEPNGAGPALPAHTNGPDGRSAAVRARPVFDGSGLAGLAERVRSLGGELAAGSVEPRGFRLRVVVPLASQASE